MRLVVKGAVSAAKSQLLLVESIKNVFKRMIEGGAAGRYRHWRRAASCACYLLLCHVAPANSGQEGVAVTSQKRWAHLAWRAHATAQALPIYQQRARLLDEYFFEVATR